jgi:hypothetical protein
VKQREIRVQESGFILDQVSGTKKLSEKRPGKGTIDHYFQKKGKEEKYEEDSDIQKRFDLNVVAFLSNCGLPYSFVETRGFKHFIKILDSKYTLRDRHTMSHKLGPLLYQNLHVVLEEVLSCELPHCESVSFSYAEWTSHANHGYLSLNIHYINPKFQLRKFSLYSRSTERKTDDQGLASLISSMISTVKGDIACEFICILLLLI